MKYVLYVIGFVMLVDVLGFIVWVGSDSRPADDIYAGVITTTIIRSITN